MTGMWASRGECGTLWMHAPKRCSIICVHQLEPRSRREALPRARTALPRDKQVADLISPECPPELFGIRTLADDCFVRERAFDIAEEVIAAVVLPLVGADGVDPAGAAMFQGAVLRDVGFQVLLPAHRGEGRRALSNESIAGIGDAGG